MKFEPDITEHEVLNYLIDSGTISIDQIRDQIRMNRRQEILKKHKFKIWQGVDGNYRTYLPDPQKGRRLLKYTTLKALQDTVISFYSGQAPLTDKQSHRFRNCFDDWIQYCTNVYKLSDNTITKYQRDYRRFFEGTKFESMDIRCITSIDIEALMASKITELGLSRKATYALFHLISGVLKLEWQKRRIPENPCVYIDKNRWRALCKSRVKTAGERTLSISDRTALLSLIKRYHEEKPNYMPAYAIELAMHTGLRVGEIAGLTWDSIDFENKIMVISKSEKYNPKSKEHYISTTKTGKERYFPLTNNLIDFFNNLREVENRYGYLSEYIFSNETGRIHFYTISTCMQRFGKSLGIKARSIHALRRTINSEMKCSGVSTTIAASLLGHSEEINNTYYTYDVTEMATKRRIVEEAEQKMLGLAQ